MGRVWECSWDYAEKRFIPTVEKYLHLKKKSEIDKAVSCELCLSSDTISNIRQALEKRSWLMEKNCNIAVFTKLQPAHLKELPSPKQEEKKVEYILNQLEKEETITVKRISQLKKEYEKSNTPALPEEPFDVIYADPPWTYDVNFLSASPNSHYQTMTTDEIIEKKPNTMENAILFLWSTNPMLEEALKVMKAWGFIYKTNIVWVKNRMGLGFYVRGQHELLLIGVKGKAHPPEESCRISSVLEASVQEHSKKPLKAYEIIERMYPNSSRVELFAREKREGWISWGNEI